jgi:hypothetical protein
LIASEDSTTILDGFTIKNGTGTYFANLNSNVGGGIYISNTSNPSIINCVIKDNSPTGGNAAGGGIWCNNSNPTFSNVNVLNNYSPDNGGRNVV